MKSPSISILARTYPKIPYCAAIAGFTLIELMIVIAISAGLTSLGIIAGLDTYQRYMFRSDLETTATLLQKARSSAVNNIGSASHGVYLGDPDNLVLFRGPSYGALPAYDLNVGKSNVVSYSDTCPGHEVIFSQLSGATTDCQITLGGIQNAVITINHEGGIDW